jgi:CBS domain containing-hemolysin-like protein
MEIDLALLLLSTVLLAIFSGAYAALELLSYSRLEKNGEEETAQVHFIDRLLEHPVSTYLSLGFVRLLAVAFVAVTSFRFAINHIFEGSPSFIASFFFVLSCIFLPAVIARYFTIRNPEKLINVFRFVLQPVTIAARPAALVLIGFFRGLAPGFLEGLSFQILPLRKRIERFGLKNGEEESEEQDLMSSVLEFGETKVREVMVPRIDMVAVNLNTEVSAALNQIIEAGHSRIPVYDESIDRMIGIVHTKDLLKKIVAGEDFSLNDIRRDVYFVPESKMIDDLLSEFKKRKNHIAIVVDEYGGTAGLITLEDILEELVGDIQDEFDAEEELIKRLDSDSALCNAKVRLAELNEEFGLGLPEDDVDTLGGLLYRMIGRMPRAGDRVRRDNIEYSIQSVVRQRIDKVIIKGLSSIQRSLGGKGG